MGYRLTFYKCPNECAERFRHTTYDDFEFSTDDFEEMFYDITNWTRNHIWYTSVQHGCRH